MRLEPDQVVVEMVEVQTDAVRLATLYGLLCENQKRRADRFHFDDSRHSFITAHGIARERLGLYLEIDPSEVQFQYGSFGKPSLKNDDSPPPLEFNISHSGNWVALAFCRNRAVGIDIERVREMDRLLGLARRTFSPQEAQEIETFAEGDEQHAAFFTCWTRNEASVKVFGLGLTMDLDKFNVSPIPGLDYCESLQAEHNGLEMEWRLQAIQAPPGYLAALACSGHEPFGVTWAEHQE